MKIVAVVVGVDFLSGCKSSYTITSFFYADGSPTLDVMLTEKINVNAVIAENILPHLSQFKIWCSSLRG